MITRNTISVLLPCSSNTSFPAFLPLGWLQVLWNGTPDPAQPTGDGFPARPKMESCSRRDAAAENVLQPWGMSERGRLALRFSRSPRHEVTSEKPLHTYPRDWHITYVRSLAFRFHAVSRPACDVSSAQ